MIGLISFQITTTAQGQSLQFRLCWRLFIIGKWKSTNRNFGDTRPPLAYKRDTQVYFFHSPFCYFDHKNSASSSCDLSTYCPHHQQLSLHYAQPIPKNMQTGTRLCCFFLVLIFASAGVSAQGNVATQWAQFLDELLVNTSSANIGPNAVLPSIPHITHIHLLLLAAYRALLLSDCKCHYFLITHTSITFFFLSWSGP